MADGRIFISYRRGPDNNAAGRIYDRMRDEFGAEAVFMDVDAMPPGIDFHEHLRRTVAKCDVFLAVIGEGWRNDAGRLASDDDFVRIEIEAALARANIPVIPVLVDGAGLPAREDLPPALWPLLRRSAVALSHEAFASAMGAKLVAPIRERLGLAPMAKTGTRSGQQTGQGPGKGTAGAASTAAPTQTTPPTRTNWGVFAMKAVIVILALYFVLIFLENMII